MEIKSDLRDILDLIVILLIYYVGSRSYKRPCNGEISSLVANIYLF